MAAEAPLPLPPRPKDSRYQSFDFWRGAACLMLLCHHAAFYADATWRPQDPSTWSAGSWSVRLIQWMWIGVPIFFVVSGYCIAGSVDSLRRRPQSLTNYFVRRFRRIYPPLWIMLATGLLFTMSMQAITLLNEKCNQLPRLSEFTPGDWLGNLTASESWLHQLSGSSTAKYLMPNTWTLCYEEQFYAVCGIMLLISARNFFSLSAVLTLLTLVSRHLCRWLEIESAGFFFDGHWLMFAAGILVYHCVNYGNRRARLISCSGLLAGMLYAALDRSTQTDHFQRHLDEYLFTASGFAIALILCRRWDSWLASQKLARPVAFCGGISYSIYLTHYLLVVVIACVFAETGFHADHLVAGVVVPASVGLAIPPAWLFHRAVERHFMNAAT